MSEIKTNEAVAQEQELSEILQVRRDKLANLQEEGRDPFQQTRFVRSAYSAEIKADYAARPDRLQRSEPSHHLTESFCHIV